MNETPFRGFLSNPFFLARTREYIKKVDGRFCFDAREINVH